MKYLVTLKYKDHKLHGLLQQHVMSMFTFEPRPPPPELPQDHPPCDFNSLPSFTFKLLHRISFNFIEMYCTEIVTILLLYRDQRKIQIADKNYF